MADASKWNGEAVHQRMCPMDFPDDPEDQAKRLEDLLRTEFPGAALLFDEEREENQGLSIHAILSHTIRPYIERLFRQNHRTELERIWAFLERLTKDGGLVPRNRLFEAVLEEIDPYPLFFLEFMSTPLQQGWEDYRADRARRLENDLLAAFPGIAPIFDEERDEDGVIGAGSEYSVLACGVRPYVEQLLRQGDSSELESIWGFLDRLAKDGGRCMRNELLVVVLEDMDTWLFFEWIGPILRQRWLEAVTYYPEWRELHTPINTHIDRERYVARWCEEIEKIGGFQDLTAERRSAIVDRLYPEFHIESI